MPSEPTRKGPGRPAKAPDEKIKLAVMCASTFPPEIAKWLETRGDGSRNTGLNRVVREAYESSEAKKQKAEPQSNEIPQGDS